MIEPRFTAYDRSPFGDQACGWHIGHAIAQTAETWIDVPFRWQGSVRAGCDCKGLVAGVARELGRPEADSVEALAGDYGAKVPVRELKAGMARLFDRVTDLEPGDVLLLKVGGAAQHLAIYAPKDGRGGLRVIEAMFKGPERVRPYRRRLDEIDSIWRWRDG